MTSSNDRIRVEIVVYHYLQPTDKPDHLIEDDAELTSTCRVLRDALEQLPYGGAITVRKAEPPATKRTKETK